MKFYLFKLLVIKELRDGRLHICTDPLRVHIMALCFFNVNLRDLQGKFKSHERTQEEQDGETIVFWALGNILNDTETFHD